MPAPGDDQIVIRNHAVAVNPLDWIIQVAGSLAYRWLSYPAVLGSDVAGEVAEAGKAVTRFRVGDRVLGHAAGHRQGQQPRRRRAASSSTPWCWSGWPARSRTRCRSPPPPFSRWASRPRPAACSRPTSWDCGTTSAPSCVRIAGACPKGSKFVSIGSPPVSFESLAGDHGRSGLPRLAPRLVTANMALQVNARRRGIRTKYIFGTTLKANEVSAAIYRDFLPGRAGRQPLRRSPPSPDTASGTSSKPWTSSSRASQPPRSSSPSHSDLTHRGRGTPGGPPQTAICDPDPGSLTR